MNNRSTSCLSLFSDSDEDEMNELLITKKAGTQKRKLERPLSPTAKVTKYLHEQQLHGPDQLKGKENDEMNFGSKCGHTKKNGSEFVTPTSRAPSRKRANGEQSAVLAKATSSTSLLMVKGIPSHSRGGGGGSNCSAWDESCYSDFCSDDDGGSLSGRSKVSELIGKLGTEIQQKVRAKRQKLTEQFKGINAIPLNIHRMNARHAEERQKLVEILRKESENIQERMDNMIHLGTVQYEKHQECLALVTQGSEEVRLAIQNVINLQAALYKKFTEDLKSFDQKHTEGINCLTQMCENSLHQLHARLEQEIVQTETETLAKIKV